MSSWGGGEVEKQPQEANMQSKSNISFRKEPVRFGSVLDFSKVHRFGSVRFGSEQSFSWFDFRLHFSDASRRGQVRLVRFRVRFRPVPELHGSVRFGSVRLVRLGSACSVRFLIPSRNKCKISVEKLILGHGH